VTASIELSLVTQVYYSAGKRLLRATVEYRMSRSLPGPPDRPRMRAAANMYRRDRRLQVRHGGP
jgi:hypothetical protein